MALCCGCRSPLQPHVMGAGAPQSPRPAQPHATGAGAPRSPMLRVQKLCTAPCRGRRIHAWPRATGAGAQAGLTLRVQESGLAPRWGGQECGVTSGDGCRSPGCPPERPPRPHIPTASSARKHPREQAGKVARGDTVASRVSASARRRGDPRPLPDPEGGKEEALSLPSPSSPSWCRKAGDTRQEAAAAAARR